MAAVDIDHVSKRFRLGHGASLVDALRRSPAFIPRLSLVALDGAQIVGHILFTAVEVGSGRESHPALALAPMAVLPAFQRRGIGSSLVRRGLDDARDLGHGVVIVVGHPGYYPRFGFVPAEPLGIRAPPPIIPGNGQLSANGALTSR